MTPLWPATGNKNSLSQTQGQAWEKFYITRVSRNHEEMLEKESKQSPTSKQAVTEVFHKRIELDFMLSGYFMAS